jgi:hypothetical protein
MVEVREAPAGPDEAFGKRRVARNMILWTTWGAYVFFVAVVTFKYAHAPQWKAFEHNYPALHYSLEALLTNIPILVGIQLIITSLEDLRVGYLITDTIAQIFLGQNRDVFLQLDARLKRRIVRESLENLLESQYGSILYSQIVAPYLEEESPYRRAFRYHIACEDTLEIERPPLAPSPAAFFLERTKDKFTWIRQEVSYTRHGFKIDRAQGQLVAVFAFTQAQLNSFVMNKGSREIFFRELIRIPEEHKQFLFSLNDEGIMLVFTSVFRFRAYDPETRTKLETEIGWKTGAVPSDKYVEVRVRNPSGRLEGSGCRLEFVLPHDKADRQFLVTLPNPIEAGAEVSFTRSASMTTFSCIPFTSQFRTGGTTIDTSNPDKICITTGHWLFPTSGAMFVWTMDEPQRVEVGVGADGTGISPAVAATGA